MKKILINNYLKVSIRILFTFLIGISLLQAEKKRAFPKLVNPAIAPDASVTTDILNERRAIIPVSNTPVAI